MKLKRDIGEFPGRLEFAMVMKKITIAQLASSIGYATSTIEWWLSGRFEPGMCAVRQLCKTLNVSADWLCCLVPFETQKFRVRREA